MNFSPSTNEISLAPIAPGIIAVRPTAANIIDSEPTATFLEANDSIPYAIPYIDSSNFSPLTREISLAPIAPGIIAVRPMDANIRLPAPLNRLLLPKDVIPLAIPCIDFSNLSPSTREISLAPIAPGIIAVRPTDANIKLPVPFHTEVSPNALSPVAIPSSAFFSFSPSTRETNFAPTAPGIIAVKPIAVGIRFNAPNKTSLLANDFNPSAIFCNFFFKFSPSSLPDTFSPPAATSSALPAKSSPPITPSTFPSTNSCPFSVTFSVKLPVTDSVAVS